MGYSSLYIVQNFGMLCFTIFLPFTARILAPVVVCIGKYSYLKVDYSSIIHKTRNWLQYGFWISFFDETYLFLLVCSALNLRDYFEWKTSGDSVNSIIALFFAILLVGFPIFVSIFYSKKKYYDLIEKRDKVFIERFGIIIEGLNFKRRGRLTLFYPCMQLFRKMWLAYILVFQYDKPVLNIFCVMVQTLVMMAVTGMAEPMISISENRM